jgi:hypothetical protein
MISHYCWDAAHGLQTLLNEQTVEHYRRDSNEYDNTGQNAEKGDNPKWFLAWWIKAGLFILALWR